MGVQFNETSIKNQWQIRARTNNAKIMTNVQELELKAGRKSMKNLQKTVYKHRYEK